MHSQKCPNCGESLATYQAFSFGNIAILDSGRVRYEGNVIDMPRCSFAVTEALVLARGRALSRAHLADLLGGEIYDDTIAVYIGRVRSLFRQIDNGFDQIAAVQGFGSYKWLHRQPRNRDAIVFEGVGREAAYPATRGH